MRGQKRIPAVFFRTELGNEPAREFLQGLPADERRKIGEAIKLVEFAWPIGMPVTRPLGQGLHEVRINLAKNRISRVFFYVSEGERMVLLHAIIKKTQTAPEAIHLARERMKQYRAAERSIRSQR